MQLIEEVQVVDRLRLVTPDRTYFVSTGCGASAAPKEPSVPAIPDARLIAGHECSTSACRSKLLSPWHNRPRRTRTIK
jgi:hypothetical protein